MDSSAVRMVKTFLYIFRPFRAAASAACKKARLYSSMSRKAPKAFKQKTFGPSKSQRHRVLILGKRMGTFFVRRAHFLCGVGRQSRPEVGFDGPQNCRRRLADGVFVADGLLKGGPVWTASHISRVSWPPVR